MVEEENSKHVRTSKSLSRDVGPASYTWGSAASEVKRECRWDLDQIREKEEACVEIADDILDSTTDDISRDITSNIYHLVSFNYLQRIESPPPPLKINFQIFRAPDVLTKAYPMAPLVADSLYYSCNSPFNYDTG
jgi:hypothetical protein